MRDPSAMDLAWLHTEIRHRVGGAALQLPEEVAAVVDAVLTYWPEPHMAELARRKDQEGAGREALDAIGVIAAKVREVLEAGCATDEQSRYVDLLCLAVVVEMANMWFSSVEHRIGMRRLCRQLRQGRAA